MRILILGLNFAPELIGVGKYTADFAAWLSERGHQVRDFGTDGKPQPVKLTDYDCEKCGKN